METLNDLIPLRGTEPVRPFCWGLRVPAGVLHVVIQRGPLSDVPYQLWL